MASAGRKIILFQQHFCIAADYEQEIVEVVRDATGEFRHGFRFL
jgi:hypothetical protein